MPPRKTPRVIDSFLGCAQEQDTHFYKTRRFHGKRDAISYLRDHLTHCPECEWWDSMMEMVSEADKDCMERKREGLEQFLDQHVSHIEAYSSRLAEERQAARKDRVKTRRVNRQLLEAQEKHQSEMEALKKQMQQQMEEQIAALKAQYEPKKTLIARKKPVPVIKKTVSSDSSDSGSGSDSEESESDGSDSESESPDAAKKPGLPKSAREAVAKSVVKSVKSNTKKKPAAGGDKGEGGAEAAAGGRRLVSRKSKATKSKAPTAEEIEQWKSELSLERQEESRLEKLLAKSRAKIESLVAKIEGTNSSTS